MTPTGTQFHPLEQSKPLHTGYCDPVSVDLSAVLVALKAIQDDLVAIREMLEKKEHG